MAGIVCVAKRSFARQMQVPEARQPKAQCSCPLQGWKQCSFGWRKRADGLIAAEESGRSLVVRAGFTAIDVPVIEAHGDIEQKRVASGKVESRTPVSC